jgi:hypothetical protein
MKRGLALFVLGLWAILQTTKGPLAEKLGLISTPAARAPVTGPSTGGVGPLPQFPTVPGPNLK